MIPRWLLDTNVVSEISKPRANADVMAFLGALDIDETCISAITLAELRKGAARAKSKRPELAQELEIWIDGLERDFNQRVLAVDASVAKIWGEMMADRDRPVMDMLIAATAVVHDLTLVTRNVRDFAGLEVKIVNPWE